MDRLSTIKSGEIAAAASAFQEQLAGLKPQSVSVVMGEKTLVITLHGALSPAEKVLAQVREYHRQLFANSSEPLRREIKRIIGMDVREAAAEAEPASGAVVHAFATGTMVQVFQLGKGPAAVDAEAPVPA